MRKFIAVTALLFAALPAFAQPARQQKTNRAAQKSSPSSSATSLASRDGRAATVPTAGSSVLLDTMQAELKRAISGLEKADPAPYFISYSATDRQNVGIIATGGALLTSTQRHNRTADVSVRVASAGLDNTHGRHRTSGIQTALLPLE